MKINIEEEMKTSYIDYSMSVIVARALPDVRDGFKPVHRRILYGMLGLGNTSDKPYETDASGQYPFGWRLEISNRQARWLETEALDTQNRIIVFSHAPLHNAGIFGTEGMPMGIKPYDDTLNGPRAYLAVKRCPKVVAMIAGHVHYDNLLYDDRILSITSLCSLAQEWAPGCPRREFGTITETAFDVFSVRDDLIRITRFGAGTDRAGVILQDQR